MANTAVVLRGRIVDLYPDGGKLHSGGGTVDFRVLKPLPESVHRGDIVSLSGSMVESLLRLSYFYSHESCGQCTPCREGTTWVTKILRRIEDGRGTEEDLDTLIELTDQMTGTTICVLSDSVAAPVQSSIAKFRDEYLALIRRGERVGVA